MRTPKTLIRPQADAKADLSLRVAHMPFCRFCHALAQISSYLKLKTNINLLNSKILHPFNTVSEVNSSVFAF